MSPLLISSPFLSRQSDARLVALVHAGNDRAFEVLVKRYRVSLLAYARRLLGSESRAEDALQQALLQAWVALRTNAEPLDVKPWLYRIVHNASVNLIRRRHHNVVELNEALDAPAESGDSEARVVYKETLAHVAALPELQRRAIVLTAFGGSSHEETAAALGLTDGAVRGLVHRARVSLRRAAAAILPAPVGAWSAARGMRRAPFSERIAELVTGAGSVGAGGLLVKGGGLLAVTAGVVATAAQVGVAPLFSSGHRGSRAAVSIAAFARTSQSSNGARTAQGQGVIAIARTSGMMDRASAERVALRGVAGSSLGPTRGRGSGGRGRSASGFGEGRGSTGSSGGGRAPTAAGTPSTGHGSGRDDGGGDRSGGGPGPNSGAGGGTSDGSGSGSGSSGSGSGSTGSGSGGSGSDRSGPDGGSSALTASISSDGGSGGSDGSRSGTGGLNEGSGSSGGGSPSDGSDGGGSTTVAGTLTAPTGTTTTSTTTSTSGSGGSRDASGTDGGGSGIPGH